MWLSNGKFGLKIENRFLKLWLSAVAADHLRRQSLMVRDLKKKPFKRLKASGAVQFE